MTRYVIHNHIPTRRTRDGIRSITPSEAKPGQVMLSLINNEWSPIVSVKKLVDGFTRIKTENGERDYPAHARITLRTPKEANDDDYAYERPDAVLLAQVNASRRHAGQPELKPSEKTRAELEEMYSKTYGGRRNAEPEPRRYAGAKDAASVWAYTVPTYEDEAWWFQRYHRGLTSRGKVYGPFKTKAEASAKISELKSKDTNDERPAAGGARDANKAYKITLRRLATGSDYSIRLFAPTHHQAEQRAAEYAAWEYKISPEKMRELIAKGIAVFRVVSSVEDPDQSRPQFDADPDYEKWAEQKRKEQNKSGGGFHDRHYTSGVDLRAKTHEHAFPRDKEEQLRDAMYRKTGIVRV